jgi:hypothetical protein
MTKTMDDHSLWDPVHLDFEHPRVWQLGPLKFWVRNDRDEWRLGVARFPDDRRTRLCAVRDTPPEDIEWSRWVVGENCVALRLSPLLPDYPIVVRPESQLGILPGNKALFFVLLPIWIQVNAVEKDGRVQPLCELPTFVSSKTWFGDPLSGELAYSLKTLARKAIEPGEPGVHQASCPVYINNTASVDLIFTRLCIRVSHLSLFEDADHLWTNEVYVGYRGKESISQIRYFDKPPSYGGKKVPVGTPRKKIGKSFAQKSFDTFKFFAGI